MKNEFANSFYIGFSELKSHEREKIIETLTKINTYKKKNESIVYVCSDCGVFTENNPNYCSICGCQCFTKESLEDIN